MYVVVGFQFDILDEDTKEDAHLIIGWPTCEQFTYDISYSVPHGINVMMCCRLSHNTLIPSFSISLFVFVRRVLI